MPISVVVIFKIICLVRIQNNPWIETKIMQSKIMFDELKSTFLNIKTFLLTTTAQGVNTARLSETNFVSA